MKRIGRAIRSTYDKLMAPRRKMAARKAGRTRTTFTSAEVLVALSKQYPRRMKVTPGCEQVFSLMPPGPAMTVNEGVLVWLDVEKKGDRMFFHIRERKDGT